MWRSHPHTEDMDDVKPRARFEAVELNGGSGWHVRVTLRYGKQAHISGFKSECEAHKWIETKSATWLKEYESGRHV
jgi:hypothetical protein